jgi:hypothetical protein
MGVLRKQRLEEVAMWKLALVQGPNVTYFDASGTQRKSFSDFPTAVAAMLKDGWEPFAADSGNTVLVWFRLRV